MYDSIKEVSITFKVFVFCRLGLSDQVRMANTAGQLIPRYGSGQLITMISVIGLEVAFEHDSTYHLGISTMT